MDIFYAVLAVISHLIMVSTFEALLIIMSKNTNAEYVRPLSLAFCIFTWFAGSLCGYYCNTEKQHRPGFEYIGIIRLVMLFFIFYMIFVEAFHLKLTHTECLYTFLLLYTLGFIQRTFTENEQWIKWAYYIVSFYI